MFQLKLDVGYKSIDHVYAQNEKTFGGRYPVGSNGFWHSGIHIVSRKVYPMLEGWLVAYNISEEYKRIPRLAELSKEKYDNLDQSEKDLYEEFKQGVTKKYRLKMPCPKPDELYSNSFYLIKHQIRLPVPSNNSPPNNSLRRDILEFFTLYTNIAHAPKRNENDYRPLEEMCHETEITFYEEYKFKVVSVPNDSHPYTLKGIQKIFNKNLCYFRFENDQSYICTFFNQGGTGLYPEITIDKNSIKQIHAPMYRTKKADDIPFYEAGMPFEEAEQEKYLVGNLKNNCYIGRVDFAYTGNGGFCKTIVKPDSIQRDATGRTRITVKTEFIVRLNDLVIDTPGMGYFNITTSTPKEKGIMIYDGKKEDDVKKNNVLGIMTGGTEFELEDPQEFWRQYNQTDNFFVALKRRYATERKRYLYFKKRPSDIEVLIKKRENYKYGDTVICNGSMSAGGYELMDHDTFLGKSVEQVAGYRDHYDLVLLFDKGKAGFLDTRALDGYRIPPEAELYTKVTNNNETQFNKASDKILEEKIVLKDETVSETDIGTGMEYRGFFYKGKLQYMPETEITKHSDKILDWDKNFIKIGSANNKNSELMKEIFQLVVEHHKGKNKKEKWFEKEWSFKKITEEPSIVKQLKRKLVCRHPLEWDKDLYARNGPAPWWFKPPWSNERFMEKVKANDIWGGLKGKSIEGLDLSENNFIFVHPVYFANYLDKEGLLTDQRIRKLKTVQDEVVALPCFKHGDGRGMYGQNNSENTYCNHATYITIQAVDEYYCLFIGNTDLYAGDHPPWDIGVLTADFRDILIAKGFLNDQNYFFKESNIWCDILAEQAARGILVELSERQIQDYANMGYAVIVAWKNVPFSTPSINYSPHYATVRPGFKFESLSDIMLANVGGGNGIMNVNSGFPRIRTSEIRWYYNPNQGFHNKEIFQKKLNEVFKYLGYR